MEHERRTYTVEVINVNDLEDSCRVRVILDERCFVVVEADSVDLACRQAAEHIASNFKWN